MRTSLEPPKFASDAEESEWWYANREVVNQELLDGFHQGRMKLVKGTPERKTSGMLSLDPADATRAHAAAERLGMSFESFVRQLVHEGLQREDARSGR